MTAPAIAVRAESVPARVHLFGVVEDPQGGSVANASIKLQALDRAMSLVTAADDQGYYEFHAILPGKYRLTAEAPGFTGITTSVTLVAGQTYHMDLKFVQLATQNQQAAVVAFEPASLSPDPLAQIVVHDGALESNSGGTGVPISLPGLPVETASGGVKAPQYFAPGVAGDHGEPIAQYVQIGDFFYPNNLPANAHGNGYADPNFLISRAIGAVQADGGAFNVREGNNAVNLAVIYDPRPCLEPFLQLTGDYRDFSLASGWSPSNPGTRAWIAAEASYGNGFLRRLEHRQQYKLNAHRVFTRGRHDLTLFTAGYYGYSRIPGLIPTDVPVAGNTIDSRQMDRTHTGLFAASDTFRISDRQEVQFSAFFRTYNLTLRSNFGDGLIEQSEVRTVAGGNASYVHKFGAFLSFLGGLDLRRDAPRNLDLKHLDAQGVFERVTSNDLTLGFATPFVSLDGSLSRYFHYDVGIRQEEISFDNRDMLKPANSFHRWAGLTLPKATFTLLPPESAWLPKVSFSFGEAFHTNNPRIGQGTAPGGILAPSHAAQLVLEKSILRTQFRVTLARVTNAQELAKIDPDTGLQQDVGPSIVRSLMVSARRSFSFGYLQGSFARATATDRLTGDNIPEAPRLIWDAVGSLNRLPLGLRLRGELEYVGRKPLGSGFTSVPVREIRGGLARSCAEGRMDFGVNFLLARGFTGQTVETLQLAGEPAAFPRIAGVPLKSYVSLTWTYNFRRAAGNSR